MDVATVCDWLSIATPAPASPEYIRCDRQIAAVVTMARRRCRLYQADGTDPLPLPAATADWPVDLANASIMQAARLYRRRSSPEGLAEFPGLDAIPIRRWDPDIENQLADYLLIGFA